MSTEPCKLCNQDSTPWVHINGHICEQCYANTKRLFCKTEPSWIDVKDKLPEAAEPVLVTDGLQICIAFLQTEKKRFTQVNTWDDWIHESVTHWMPLPETPK